MQRKEFGALVSAKVNISPSVLIQQAKDWNQSMALSSLGIYPWAVPEKTPPLGPIPAEKWGQALITQGVQRAQKSETQPIIFLMVKMVHPVITLPSLQAQSHQPTWAFFKRFSSQLLSLLLITVGSRQTETKLRIHFLCSSQFLHSAWVAFPTWTYLLDTICFANL